MAGPGSFFLCVRVPTKGHLHHGAQDTSRHHHRRCGNRRVRAGSAPQRGPRGIGAPSRSRRFRQGVRHRHARSGTAGGPRSQLRLGLRRRTRTPSRGPRGACPPGPRAGRIVLDQRHGRQPRQSPGLRPVGIRGSRRLVLCPLPSLLPQERDLRSRRRFLARRFRATAHRDLPGRSSL